MAKKSQRRPVRYERDQAGCIWGLISIFDFRHGRFTRKLLSDKRHGSKHAGVSTGAGYSRTKVNMLTNSDERCQSIDDCEDSETETAVKTSVKELMEEEMFSEQGSKKCMNAAEVELEQYDSDHHGRGHVKKNYMRTKTTCEKSCDLDAARNLGPEKCFHQVLEQNTSNNLDLEIIMEELCQIHQKSSSSAKHDWHDDLDMQSNQEKSVEEKLGAAIEVFMNQRFTKGKHLTEDGKTHHSKEFMDALQTLSSNKDLFLRLLQDPNSLLVKHIQGLEDAQVEEATKALAGSNLSEKERKNSRPGELITSKHRNFFRRKSKSQESCPVKGNEKCQPSSRIVILKPGSAGLQNPNFEIDVSSSSQSRDKMENKAQSARNPSQFSFTEIKRKLKHAMGKERQVISHNGVTHKFPYEHQNYGNGEKGIGEENGKWSSPNRNHFYTEIFAKPSIGIKRGDQNSKSRDSETNMVNETNGNPMQGVSNIYIEAKKHLLEMLSNEKENAELMSRQLPKSLGGILSLPEFNFSPSCSPGKDGEHSFLTEQMRLSAHNNLHMVNENTWHPIQENHIVHVSPSGQEFETQSCIINGNPDEKVQSPNTYRDASYEPSIDHSVEETLSVKDEISCEGGLEIVKTTNTGGSQKDTKVLDVLCEPSSSLLTMDVQNCDTAEVCDEERFSESYRLDTSGEDQLFSSPSVSPSSSSVPRKIEDPESAIDRIERPSPISVLEHVFTEDDISPASTTSRSVETAVEQLHIHFEEGVSSATDQAICIRTCMEDEESAYEYVEAVLLGSDLNWDEFLSRWLSSDQLLDPSLFDEVGLFTSQSCHDQKLLFDCTNEVLKEVCEQYFGCFSGVSFVKQNIRPVPKGMNLIHEVWEGVEWHLLQPPPPCSLDQLVRKDMAKSGTWMDLRFETEHIVIEIGESILEALMEDTVLSFVNDSKESDFPVLPPELKEDESSINC